MSQMFRFKPNAVLYETKQETEGTRILRTVIGADIPKLLPNTTIQDSVTTSASGEETPTVSIKMPNGQTFFCLRTDVEYLKN